MRFEWVPLSTGAGTLELVRKLNERMRVLVNVLSSLNNQAFGVGDIANADATPALAGFGLWRTANTGATTITALTGVTGPATRVIIFGDSNTTLQHGSNLQLIGDANFAATAGDVVTLVTDDGTLWREAPQPHRWS
jgi:hypothetical protein